MMGGFGFSTGMFGIGALIMIAFWVLVIGGCIWLVITLARANPGQSASPTPSQAPLDILKARYAKGEISKEQFDAIKRDLGV